MSGKISFFTRILLIGLSFVLAACGGTDTISSGGQDAAEVSVQLSWTHEYSAAEFYAAERNGHFADEDLSVIIREGGFGEAGYIEPIDQVLSGEVDFGLASAAALIQARAEGKPVVAIASILQRSPFALLSLQEDNILRPQDLSGHTVAVSDGGARTIYDALLVSQDINTTEVNTVPRTEFGIDPLVNGEVDVMAAWITNEGVALQEAGYDLNYILVSDYGVDTYDKVLFTTETMIAENPEVVERFLRALLAGLEDVVNDPENAAGLTLTYNSDLVLAEQSNRLLASVPLIAPAGARLGDMQPEVWEITQQIMVEDGGLDVAVNLDEVYTLTFLNKIYS